jgi:hypothetical protein
VTQAATCAWCGRAFTARATGGHPQRFCRSACRRAFDAAGRRWVAGAIASGMLTVDALRNGARAKRALLPGAGSPAPISPAEKPAPVAPTERPQYVVIALDRMCQMELRELKWNDPVYPATPNELAALASALFRIGLRRRMSELADERRIHS